VAALLVYICCTLFVSAFVFNFISVVMLLAIDFWTVRHPQPSGLNEPHRKQRV
jgi:hypothetical protein